MELKRDWGSITNHNMGIMRSTIISRIAHKTFLGFNPHFQTDPLVASLVGGHVDNPIPPWEHPGTVLSRKTDVDENPLLNYTKNHGFLLFFLAKGIGLIIFKHTALLTFVCRTSTWTAWTGPHAAGLVKLRSFGLWDLMIETVFQFEIQNHISIDWFGYGYI